ncbi:phytosulfokine receptor [Trifolium repens]|nr:phytosulfokine receptor [Trifolium repens]KAK2431860.1 phytosulfokine receptor [Trifolium repens]
MIMICSGGELLSSESHSFFSFLKPIDQNNVLNISKISYPCLINGVTCNSNATNIVEIRLDNMNLSGIFDAYSLCRLQKLKVVSCDEFGETLRKISKVKHQNILPVVGYRSTNEEKLIIYKYQSNGSLLNLLNDYIARRKDFPWKLRLNIACGIARGLAFIYKKLDEGEANIIPHGNIKLSNILLNDKNEALIGEHGLSKFFEPNRGTNLFSSDGYTTPEKSLTEKGDVYSFGVILLE